MRHRDPPLGIPAPPTRPRTALASRFEFCANGIVKIDGVPVAIEFIEAFIKPSPAGMWFRVDADADGLPVITTRRDEDAAP